jgi:hypothetical protein
MRTAPGGLGVSRAVHAVLVAIPIALAVAVGCSSGSDGGESGADTTGTTVVEDVVVDAADFKPLADMTPVRGFFVDNVAGDLEGTLAVANDPEGGTYPVGSVIQLIPEEAMVKRAPGFDPTSNDWEFFTLRVSPQGTTIVTRGGSEVVNRFTGGSCAECHSAAEPQFDLVCEDDHGCAPLPIPDEVITSIQQSDPRPSAGGS